ncbi:MAG: PAS domain S-box protein [Planctomycetota bacterium]|nr:PAS domain S-box protein [Planctomycetota bacterium]
MIINDNFFFIAANLIGMFAAYNSEFYARHDFFVNQELDGRNAAIVEANRTLESKVAERTQALEQLTAELRESEVKFRLLVENSHDIIYTLTAEGEFRFVSPAWTAFLGHSTTQVDGQPFQQFVHPDDLARCTAFLQSVIEGGQRQEGVEYRVRHINGSWRWHTTSAVPLRDEAGTVRGFEDTAHDITKCKQVEETLRIQHDLSLALSSIDELDQALEQILNAALRMESIACGGIYLTDPNGTLDLVVHRGLTPQFIAQVTCSLADSMQARLARDGQAHYGTYQRLRPEPNRTSAEDNLRALAVIPILHQGELLAVLNLASYRDDDIPVNTRQAIETLAQQIGSTLIRLRAVASLREGQQNLQTLFDTIDDFLFVLDGAGHILRVNAVTSNRLGYAAGELVGQDVLMAHPPDRRADAAAVVADMLAGQREFCPIPLFAKDGSLIPVETRVTPGTWGGQPALFAISRDITERKQAETYRELGREVLQILNQSGDLQDSIQCVLAALKTRTGFDAVGIRLQDGEDFPYFVQEGFSRDFLLTENTLIERATDGGLCRDQAGNVRLECTCGLVISGQTDPAHPLFTRGGSFWTNDSFPLLDLPSDQDPRLHPRNQCIHQGYASVALVPIRNKDRIIGLIHFCDQRKRCFTLATVELLEGIASHIGEALLRKQAEEVRDEALSHLQKIASRVPGVVYQYRLRPDGSACLPFASEGIQEIFRVSPAQVREDASAMFANTHPDDYAGVTASLQASARDLAPWQHEFRVKFDDGTIRALYGDAMPQREEDGSVLWHGFITDITERKRAEELRLTLTDLERSNKELEQFAYVASHDLQEPLRMVSSYTQLLARRYQGQLDANAQEFIAFAVDGANRMQSLINDLLSFSRVGTRGKEFELTDFAVVLAQALVNLQAAIQESDAVVTHDPLPILLADKSQMVNLFQNLIGNAIKFHAEQAPHVHLSAVLQEQAWLFRVRDDGIGIEPQYADRIFQIFERLHTRAEYPGTGLGLAICKKIVERHAGHIWVESQLAKGSTFYFTIPLAPNGFLGLACQA